MQETKFMKLVIAVGKRVEQLLADNDNMTQYQLSKISGLNRATIWHIVNPDTELVKTVKLDTVFQIAASLGLSLSEFFNDPIFDEISD